MKIIILFCLYLYTLEASLLDGFNRYKANTAMSSQELDKTKEYLQSIENKDDEVYYNLGNIAYKQAKYQDAIKHYMKVNSKDLEYKKLHNLGNSYVKLKNIDEAIKSYEEALTIQEDVDTKFNLELLKKEQQKDKQEQEEKDNKQDQNQENNDKKDKKEDNKNNNKSDEKNNEQNSSKSQNSEDKKDKESDSLNNENSDPKEDNKGLTSMEEQKWDKKLSQRDLGTLMIPMRNKGDTNAEDIKPW